MTLSLEQLGAKVTILEHEIRTVERTAAAERARLFADERDDHAELKKILAELREKIDRIEQARTDTLIDKLNSGRGVALALAFLVIGPLIALAVEAVLRGGV